MALQTVNGVGLDATRVEETISFNVKIRLAALGLNQSALADYLGIKRSTISVKLNGKSVWTVPDLVNTANYLETTPEALMDDSMMSQMPSRNKNAAVADTRPRHSASAPAGIRTPDTLIKSQLL
ncbi:plasmid maintenance system antidote protein [Bifidobacterium subtile]|uniref:Plasmid maintenance system antidote protein n=1 Tax=Bifidobacterium subtile TaxID=77635 RepID=A0A087E552_9BIFI|nr:plasmid maintenance system antidote protein [Bifidobacterium subtile]